MSSGADLTKPVSANILFRGPSLVFCTPTVMPRLRSAASRLCLNTSLEFGSMIRRKPAGNAFTTRSVPMKEALASDAFTVSTTAPNSTENYLVLFSTAGLHHHRSLEARSECRQSMWAFGSQVPAHQRMFKPLAQHSKHEDVDIQEPRYHCTNAALISILSRLL